MALFAMNRVFSESQRIRAFQALHRGILPFRRRSLQLKLFPREGRKKQVNSSIVD